MAARKRTTPRRRRRTRTRRNPPMAKMITGGVKDAFFLLGGEAGTRAIPTMVGLPSGGATGKLIQAAVAIALGYGADRFLGAAQGAQVLAGGLAVPIRDLVVEAGVPILSPALTPTPLGGGVYPRAARLSGGVYPKGLRAGAPGAGMARGSRNLVRSRR